MLDAEATRARILIVEDDAKTADLVALYLRRAGHDVTIEYTGNRALARLGQEQFDLLILDIMVPAPNGLEICRRVRNDAPTPIIFLSARSLEEQRLEGFGLGADDYVTKPFSPRELVARVQAVLRRITPSAHHVLRYGNLELNDARRTVRLDDAAITLTRSEFALLEALMEHPGHVWTRAHLMSRLPTGEGESFDRVIDVHVRNIRRKLEAADPSYRLIETVFGVGYRIAERTSNSPDVP